MSVKTDTLDAAQTLLSRVHQRSTTLVEPRCTEDVVLLSMEDASQGQGGLPVVDALAPVAVQRISFAPLVPSVVAEFRGRSGLVS